MVISFAPPKPLFQQCIIYCGALRTKPPNLFATSKSTHQLSTRLRADKIDKCNRLKHPTPNPSRHRQYHRFHLGTEQECPQISWLPLDGTRRIALCLALRPVTRVLHNRKLERLSDARINLMTSFSGMPYCISISSKLVLSHHAIRMISLLSSGVIVSFRPS